jgi:hypothetical protein
VCSAAVVAVTEEGEEVVMRREAPDQTRFGRAWETVRRGRSPGGGVCSMAVQEG